MTGKFVSVQRLRPSHVNFNEIAFALALSDDEMAEGAPRWTEHEFARVDLGDGRFNKRAA
jgi:hypothetical protein